MAAVPLLVKIPGQPAGRARDDDVETVDILPTIAEAIGASVPWAVDGRSLLGPPRPEAQRRRVVPAKTRAVLALDPRLDGRWRTLDRMLSTFGTGVDGDRLYRLGPYADLVGRALARTDVRAAAGPLRVVLDRPERWEAVDRASPVLPARVKGHLVAASPPRNPVHLAVAVNGVVRAVSRTHASEEGRARFSAMLPESALRDGPNIVEVLVVSGPPGRAVLQRIRAD